jgi:hypothetical protein
MPAHRKYPWDRGTFLVPYEDQPPWQVQQRLGKPMGFRFKTRGERWKSKRTNLGLRVTRYEKV